MVDDHPLFHEGLASAFARLAPDLSIVSADSAEAGLTVLRTAAIDLALIDLVLPTLDGLSALALYAAEFPHVSALADLGQGTTRPSSPKRATRGASGFLRKSLALDQLLLALREVLEGGAYFDLGAPAALPHAPAAPSDRDPSGDLTLRQLEVLKLLGDGRSNKEISSALAIADRTVRRALDRAVSHAGRVQPARKPCWPRSGSGCSVHRDGRCRGPRANRARAPRAAPHASARFRTECVRTLYKQIPNSMAAALGGHGLLGDHAVATRTARAAR